MSRRQPDCEELNNLRFQIYKTCEYTGMTESLSSDLQCELEIISDYIQSQENLKFNVRRNIITKEPEESNIRVLKFPKLGMITVTDYNLPAMPSPTMVNIDNVRFDFKSSLRNPHYRQGKQYET